MERKMKINLFFPKCKFCGGDTRKIKIYDAPDEEHLEQKKFRCYGLRCLKCNKIQEELRYWDKIEDSCCERMAEAHDNEEIAVEYDMKSSRLRWSVQADWTLAIDNIKFCPFCGVELPTKPNSIPI